MFWIPLYYEAKLLVVLWLVHDNFAVLTRPAPPRLQRLAGAAAR
jgi:hypothetical protein